MRPNVGRRCPDDVVLAAAKGTIRAGDATASVCVTTSCSRCCIRIGGCRRDDTIPGTAAGAAGGMGLAGIIPKAIGLGALAAQAMMVVTTVFILE
jgi:hypothetical protein